MHWLKKLCTSVTWAAAMLTAVHNRRLDADIIKQDAKPSTEMGGEAMIDPSCRVTIMADSRCVFHNPHRKVAVLDY